MFGGLGGLGGNDMSRPPPASAFTPFGVTTGRMPRGMGDGGGGQYTRAQPQPQPPGAPPEQESPKETTRTIEALSKRSTAARRNI